MTRKVDILDVKREHRAYDPIPPEFGHGITIQVIKVYKPTGRFVDLQRAVARRDRMFWLGDANATQGYDTTRKGE